MPLTIAITPSQMGMMGKQMMSKDMMAKERGVVTLSEGPHCPLPGLSHDAIQMAHGGGGRLSQQLLDAIFYPAFDAAAQQIHHDGAILEPLTCRQAFTTDSYVVQPLFFPGGDIGKLAVCGTVNDLAMCGALPTALSAGFILEEGLPMATLQRVVHSMAHAATQAGVNIVTGDTKVVERGRGDGLYINTAGVGRVIAPQPVTPARVEPGDVILVNGDLGRHGIAVMTQREGFEFESEIASDCADLSAQVRALFDAAIDVHCLRDLTRGGLAGNLVELATVAGTDLLVDEAAVPVREDVAGVCELLGFDPLYVACEGRMACFVPANQSARALSVLLAAGAPGPALIGRVIARSGQRAQVLLHSRIGATRVLDMLSGEQLPRIC